jgi:hypothetical protein
MRIDRRVGVRASLGGIGLVVLAAGTLTVVALVLAGLSSLLAR